MMCIFSREIVDMQGYKRMINKSLEKFMNQIDIKITNMCTCKINFKSVILFKITPYAQSTSHS